MKKQKLLIILWFMVGNAALCNSKKDKETGLALVGAGTVLGVLAAGVYLAPKIKKAFQEFSAQAKQKWQELSSSKQRTIDAVVEGVGMDLPEQARAQLKDLLVEHTRYQLFPSKEKLESIAQELVTKRTTALSSEPTVREKSYQGELTAVRDRARASYGDEQYVESGGILHELDPYDLAQLAFTYGKTHDELVQDAKTLEYNIVKRIVAKKRGISEEALEEEMRTVAAKRGIPEEQALDLLRAEAFGGEKVTTSSSDTPLSMDIGVTGLPGDERAGAGELPPPVSEVLISSSSATGSGGAGNTDASFGKESSPGIRVGALGSDSSGGSADYSGSVSSAVDTYGTAGSTEEDDGTFSAIDDW